ncbi:hypothetical protein ACFFMN_28850 [Planobispora siamensis]|uniref:Uncharacterized protein n=1 Tax=Planobispora siamensis TaxID=936338 RepID=A0A8J3SQC6_9ACTN|nr:hypothetical protein [Planobispora siamensis]GIH97424.1 hypothetical protein Psi01_80540 [Planobispora siamensis]
MAAEAGERWRERLHPWWSWVTGDGVVVHEGDLDAADLVIGPGPLVVTGDLRLTGLLEDRHRAERTLLVVLGDLEAGNVATSSAPRSSTASHGCRR